MYNITLIFTHHSELGKCNADELYKIIESIQPKVIFEELPENLFDILYKGLAFPHVPPEVRSIRRYLQKSDAKHIPVDIDVNNNFTQSDIVDLFDSFNKYEVYKKLSDEQYKRIMRDGFAFLNSKECDNIIEEKKKEEINLFPFITNKNQVIYYLLQEEIETRENQMLKNIYDYSRDQEFNIAIFTLGSGHRKSIKRKSSNTNRMNHSD